jgi:arginase
MNSDNLGFYEKKKLIGDISVLGVPLDLGKDTVGTYLGPDYIRACGLKEMCESIGLLYKDLGNIECADRATVDIGDIKIKYLDEISRVIDKTARIVKDEIKMGNKMLVLGGDHALSIGSISGASVACEGDLGLIWIDAHGDINTNETSVSGNVHGMPVAAVLGMGHHRLTEVLQPGAKIKSENIVYIGIKDLDQAEIDIMRKENISVFTIMDLMRGGIDPIAQKLAELQKRVKNIWVSLDVDSIDSVYAPATPMASPDGLTRREAAAITKLIGTLPVVGVDIVELAPEMDEDKKTGKLVVELAANLFGSAYNWYTHYMKQEVDKQTARNSKK